MSLTSAAFVGAMNHIDSKVQAVEINNTREYNVKSNNYREGKVVNVTTNLRVRSNASLNSYVLGYLYNNQTITIINEVNGWYKIKFREKEAYVSRDYIKLVDNSSSNVKYSKGKVINVNTKVNIRSEARTNSTIIDMLKNEETFDIISKIGEWYQIKVGNKYGYIHGNYVSIIASNTNNNIVNNSNNTIATNIKKDTSSNQRKSGHVNNISGSLNVRAGAGTNNKVIGYLTKGASIEITGEQGDWYKIQYNGRVGYVAKKYITVTTSQTSSNTNLNYMSVTASAVNLRDKGSTKGKVICVIKANTVLKALQKDNNGWTKVSYGNKVGYIATMYLSNCSKTCTYSKSFNSFVNEQVKKTNMKSSGNKWVNANKNDVSYYMNPDNFVNNNGKYMFMNLNYSSSIPVSIINECISGRGILSGKGQAFMNGAKKYNVNPIYLAVHARLETGNGTSKLSKGVRVTSVDGKAVTPRVVYNMYGIGAYDKNPVKYGAEYAYKQGWFTPEKAITEGARWVGANYINSSKYKQNTLYEMRWNMTNAGVGWHQYATDIAWAEKQAKMMAPYLNKCTGTLKFEIPTFHN